MLMVLQVVIICVMVLRLGHYQNQTSLIVILEINVLIDYKPYKPFFNLGWFFYDQSKGSLIVCDILVVLGKT